MAQVYALVCKVNNMVYVGCTKSGDRGKQKRFREHRCLLRKGVHAEKALQADWNRFGEGAFTVDTLKELGECTLDEKREEELWHMAWFANGNPPRLYNTNRTSFQGTEGSLAKAVAVSHRAPGNRWTPEANEKRRLAQLGKPKNHGAKVSASKKALGQRPSLEAARAGGIAVHAKRKEAKLKI